MSPQNLIAFPPLPGHVHRNRARRGLWCSRAPNDQGHSTAMDWEASTQAPGHAAAPASLQQEVKVWEQGGERARQDAAACAAPRACVALPSQGSQERDAEETLAGGVSGCPEDGFTETAAPKARAIRGRGRGWAAFLTPRPRRRPSGRRAHSDRPLGGPGRARGAAAAAAGPARPERPGAAAWLGSQR